MTERNNILIGYGERLTSELIASTGGAPKKHPYTLTEARERLTTKLRTTVTELNNLPSLLCPNDRSVALIALHPAYLAKSYYPDQLLGAYGLKAIGSQSRTLSPSKSTKKNPPKSSVTSELFIAGERSKFRKLVADIENMQENTIGSSDLIKIEDVRSQPAEEKLKALISDDKEPLLEVVLHAQPTKDAYVLEGFEAYLQSLNIKPNLDKRRFFSEGLCFLPLRVPRDIAIEVVKYSFLRLAREMPRLRQFHPIVRSISDSSTFKCELPSSEPVNSDIRVAIFDGGVVNDDKLKQWVSPKETKDIGMADKGCVKHGTAVTSAFLFGPLQKGVPLRQPYATVDHYRVLDVDNCNDDQGQLYTVLGRIQDVLETRGKYDFVNLSLGPDLPIEDNDVHAWTAVLDQLLSDGRTLTTVAVGNSGELDWDSGNARIQSPADCVNALSIGGSDRSGIGWKRACYSSIGPGRSPGIIKPDGLAFGGSDIEPFWVLDADNPGVTIPVTGTSFAAPLVLHTAAGLKAHFGSLLTPLAIKALLLHSCENNGYDKNEVGWGRIPTNIDSIVLTDEHEAHIVYQGELRPASWMRIRIPMPKDPISGIVELAVTFCYATPTDPKDPLNYTRSGLDIRFRPHDNKRKLAKQIHPDTSYFFQAKDVYDDANDFRPDAHKWETTLHKKRSMRASTLQNPVFDVHYNARFGGQNPHSADKIPYALVITISSKKTRDLYNKILQSYPTILEPLKPLVKIPIQT